MISAGSSEILLKTLQFVFAVTLVPILMECCKTTKKKKDSSKKPPKTTPESKSKTMSQEKDDKTQKQTEKEVSDVQFNLNLKHSVRKNDEFDDDEENPLAKIHVVGRARRPSQTPLPNAGTPTATPSKTPPKASMATAKMGGGGGKLESEKPLFPTESGGNKSCYAYVG